MSPVLQSRVFVSYLQFENTCWMMPKIWGAINYTTYIPRDDQNHGTRNETYIFPGMITITGTVMKHRCRDDHNHGNLSIQHKCPWDHNHGIPKQHIKPFFQETTTQTTNPKKTCMPARCRRRCHQPFALAKRCKCEGVICIYIYIDLCKW